MREFFDPAWHNLKNVYDSGVICSERHMQCELFKLLTSNNDFNNRYKIFVEPRLTLPELNSKIPDFLITEDDIVVAAVELKYVPHDYSKYEKDLKTLINFCYLFKQNKDYTFPLLTNPNNGEWTEPKFRFSDKLTLIYCTITKLDAHIITNNKKIWQDMSLWKLDDDSKHNEINYLQYVGAIPANIDKNWGYLSQ
ncbi:MAG: hypothetical protein V4560_16980 [Bacteroidota bacterium]